MSNTPETDQLEECDQYKVDEDYAEYNAYRRIVEHARKLERERDEASNALIIAVDEMVQAQSQLRDVERERDTYREQADALVYRLGATQERSMRWARERDKLAEALRKAISWGDSASHHILHRQNINWTYLNEAKETIQSLTQTTEL